MGPNREKRQSLRGGFLRVTIPLIFLSVISVFTLIELLAYRTAVVQLEQTHDGIIRTQSAALSNPVWNLDREQVLLSLQAVTTNPEILSAKVLDEKGEVMSVAGAVPERASPNELLPLHRDIVFDAGNGERVIGELEIIATRQFLWEHTRNRLMIAAIIALVAVAIEVAAALYALRSIVGRPLTRLLASINQVRSNGERQLVTWNRTDELGQVIAAYNQMQSRQQAYEVELLTARNTLEERVAERTEELATKSRQMEHLSNQLSKYLSPQVYDSIFTGRQEVAIASSRKKLTVFFSDIVDFTETTDRMESEELTQLLNHYLTEMSQIALEHGATIDKYVGDAIIIFFGDPDTKGVKKDALACVRMAVAMRQRMHELKGIWSESGIENPLQVRIGIHTGYCTVGNFGSEDRLDYTIIGGAVNTTSRLEAIAKPGEILISYETFAQVKDRFRCQEQGQVDVKGIAYPVTTYEVVGPVESFQKDQRHFHEVYPNVTVDLKIDRMNEDERSRAIETLREALRNLSTDDGSPQMASLPPENLKGKK